MTALDETISRASGGDLQGTLAVTFVEGDPDLERDVPAVPG